MCESYGTSWPPLSIESCILIAYCYCHWSSRAVGRSASRGHTGHVQVDLQHFQTNLYRSSKCKSWTVQDLQM